MVIILLVTKEPVANIVWAGNPFVIDDPSNVLTGEIINKNHMPLLELRLIIPTPDVPKVKNS